MLAVAVHLHIVLAYSPSRWVRIRVMAKSKLDTLRFYSCPGIALYQGDASAILKALRKNSVDCIVTSPPYYGQRDYGVADQIGLESRPSQYVSRLVEVFRAAKRVLKPAGSLWVNIGDTYWSGKGRPGGN